jgi:hypothetical protein
MIQFTKEFRKELARQERISQCLSCLRIVTEFGHPTASGYVTYAVVASTTATGRRYSVSLDETGDIPVATRCNCDATVECIHMEAVTQYFAGIVALFAKDEPTADEIASQAEEANMQKLATYRMSVAENAYEVLAETKRVHCGGCHNVQGEGEGSRCKPNFCFWNGFWTEAMRNAA